MVSQRDIEEARQLIDSVILHISSVIRRYQGTIVDTVGDGVFAVFGAPKSLDGHPRAAVSAALELQESMRSNENRESLFSDIELRIGISTGDVIWRRLQVGREKRFLPIGQTVNLASRLQNFAEPGSILLGESTYRLVSDFFTCSRIPDLSLKGIRDPVAAYTVSTSSDVFRNLQVSIKRGLSPLVGRNRELKQFADCIRDLEAGKGNAICFTAEAGGGKSRLLYEFTKLIPSAFKVITSFCLSHLQTSPWYAVVQVLRCLFDLSPGMSTEAIKHQLSSKLVSFSAFPAKDLPLLLQLLDLAKRPTISIDTNVLNLRANYIALIRNMLVRAAESTPLVIIIEDLHWLDFQSADAFESLLPLAADHPILILCTSRLEGLRQSWQNLSLSIINLPSLDAVSAQSLIDGIIDQDEFEESVIRQICYKTQGNPFFIEEIIRSLRGNIIASRNDMARSVDIVAMPTSIQMAIAERIDRLAQPLKHCLQVLAVIGIKSKLTVFLELISGISDQAVDVLDSLEELGFIIRFEADDSHFLKFVHILTQEVAYSSLLSDQRSLLHGHIAELIEKEYQSTPHEILPELAYHYHKSNNSNKAVHHLRLAGESAIQRSAHPEAQHHLKLALSWLEKSNEISNHLAHRSHVLLSLGVSLQVTMGYAAEEVKRAYESAVTFSEQDDNSECLLAALRGYGLLAIVRAEYIKAEQIAARMMSISRGNKVFIQEHHVLCGLSFTYRGIIDKGARHYRIGIKTQSETAKATPIHYSMNSRSVCYSYLASNVLFSGRLRSARHFARKGLEVAISSGVPIAIAQARGMLANLYFSRCDYEESSHQHAINIKFADENGFSYWSLLGRIITAWTNGYLSNDVSSVEEFNSYLEAYKGSGALIGIPWFLNIYAELLRHFDKPDDALKAIRGAEEITEATGERFFQVDTLRIKGELLSVIHGSTGSEASQHCFLEALQLAHAQGAWLPAVRVAARLASLMMSTDLHAEARQILAFYYKKVSWTKCAIYKEIVDLMVQLDMSPRCLDGFGGESCSLGIIREALMG